MAGEKVETRENPGKNGKVDRLPATGAQCLLPKRSAEDMLSERCAVLSRRLQVKRIEALELRKTIRHEKHDKEEEEDVLRERESRLKEEAQMFDHSFKKNEKLRLQALESEARDRVLMRQKDAAISSLQEELKALSEKREKLDKQLQNYAIYGEFMERVVQASDEFKEPREVVSCFDTLMRDREELARTTQLNEDSILDVGAQLARFKDESDVTLLHFNTTLQLQGQWNEALKERLSWESRWTHIQNTATKKTLLLDTIKQVLLNMHKTVCEINGTGETVAPEDTPELLERLKVSSAYLKTIEGVSRQEHRQGDLDD